VACTLPGYTPLRRAVPSEEERVRRDVVLGHPVTSEAGDGLSSDGPPVQHRAAPETAMTGVPEATPASHHAEPERLLEVDGMEAGDNKVWRASNKRKQQRCPSEPDHIPGVPSRVETSQPDPEAAVDFYRGLFGWEFEDTMPPGSEVSTSLPGVAATWPRSGRSLRPPRRWRCGTPTSGSRALTYGVESPRRRRERRTRASRLPSRGPRLAYLGSAGEGLRHRPHT
jgi:hypothetical protein